MRKKLVTRVCACGQPFSFYLSSNYKGLYCSRICYAKGRIGKPHPHTAGRRNGNDKWKELDLAEREWKLCKKS